MTAFDIENLLEFNPPGCHCEKCLALLSSPLHLTYKGSRLFCPTCGVEYIRTEEFKHPHQYLDSMGCNIEFNEIVEHARGLARIAWQIRNSKCPPLSGLLRALNAAQQFIHFATWNISHVMIGALKMAAQRVNVRGFVAVAEARTLSELTNYKVEAPQLQVKVLGSEGSWSNLAHQKLVVIDGLLAFEGSANMTQDAWRNAAEGRDRVRVVTDADEVIGLHNKYFSPIWAKLSNLGEKISMETKVPF
ncbi:MAG: phosphatidylserine/phosphatidylglycerophosphate/cardiolipin synthase family protein [Candidatus Binatia bacterium]